MRAAPFLILLLLVAGCAQAPTPRPRAVAAAAPTSVAAPATGLGRVMGSDAAGLAALFGPAALDVREGPARKLQFRGPACVLDAYLYPQAGGTPRVTWVDARTAQGGDMDRASCVAALARAR